VIPSHRYWSGARDVGTVPVAKREPNVAVTIRAMKAPIDGRVIRYARAGAIKLRTIKASTKSTRTPAELV
jgi:hypothetical protein